MTRRHFSIVPLSLLLTLMTAQAGVVSYDVTISTSPALATPGYLEFQFNQANSLTSLGSTTASISNVTQTGYTFGGNGGATPGVTGTLSSLPVVIPNDQAAANYYDEIISIWGTSISFTVTLSGPAVGGSAADGSGFYIFLLDSAFFPLIGPLGNSEAGNILINPDGSTVAEGSVFASGSLVITPASTVPEPGTVLLSLLGLAGMAAARRAKR